MLDFLLSGAGKVADRLFGVQDRRESQHFQSQQQAANIAAQREFAQQGIRWKVEDAKAAGVHPLYALGAQTHSFTPTAIGGADTPATNFGSMGQDLSRAVNATRTADERTTAYNEALQKLQLERGGLENEVLRQRLRTMVQGANPALPGTVPEADKFEERPKLKAGVDWPTHPDFVNAEDVEKRYGDLVQELYGMSVLGADSWRNWNDWAARQSRDHGASSRRKLDRYWQYLRR